MCHMSHVMCHASCVTCQMWFLFSPYFLKDKGVELVGGGSVNNGAYPVTTVSTHCDCPLTVYLNYKMEYSFWPLKNGLLLKNSKMVMIIFPKVPYEKLGPGSYFSCWSKFSTMSHKKVIGKTKQKTDPINPASLYTWGERYWKIP